MNELERLRTLVNWLVFSGYAKNDTDLAVRMGYKKSSFSQIMNGKVPLSDRFIHALCSFNENINSVWIRDGSGKMLNEAVEVYANHEKRGVPYYDVDFIGGFDMVINDQSIAPDYYVDFAPYNQADYWVNVRGRSMEPLISSGDVVALAHLADWELYLLFGEVYAIVTDSYRTIKKIRRSSLGDAFILLVPLNTEYDEQDIPRSIVVSVYRIIGVVKKLI